MASPLLTRLFDVNDFGLLAVYSSLLAIIGVVASLRYEMAIPLPESEQDAVNLVAVCLFLVSFTAVLSLVYVLLLGGVTSAMLGVPGLAKFLWLLPVGALLNGYYTVFNYYCARGKRFDVVAKTRWMQALVSIAIQLGTFKLGAAALLLGQVSSKSAGVLKLARTALKQSAFSSISAYGMLALAQRYRRFPLFSTGEGLANAASLQLPPLMFAAFFGPSAAGVYSLAMRILQMPMTLIGSAIGQVFFAHAAEARRSGTLGGLVMQLHTRLASIGLPPALVLIFSGPELFALVFGEEWRLAGICARWLAPWLYLVFVSSPMSTLFSVLERQERGLAFQAVLLFVRCGAIASGAWIGDFLLTVRLFAGFSALCWACFIIWLGRAAGISAIRMLQPTLPALLAATTCSSPLIALYVTGSVSQFNVLAGAVLSVVLIAAHYYKMHIRENTI